MTAHITYRLQRLVIGGESIEFDAPVIFWPVNARLARVTLGNGWPSPPLDMVTGVVTHLEYTMSAANDKVCVSENYVHKVEKWCVLAGKSGKGYFLHGKPLFTSDGADFLLKTPRLRKLKAIQFVC